MLARLRLLLAMFLLCLGTWFAALAVEGYLPPGRTASTEPGTLSPGMSASPDAQQFISFLTRERFVTEAAPTEAASLAGAPVKPKAPRSALKPKPAGAEKRRPAGAQWPWPLSLLGE